MPMTDFYKFPDSGDKKREQNCVICGADHASKVGKVTKFDSTEEEVVQCLECGLTSRDPLPSFETLLDEIDQKLHKEESEKERKKVLKCFGRSYRQGGHFARKYLKKYFAPQNKLKVLELGTSDGYFAQGIKHEYPLAEVFYASPSQELVRFYHGHFECKARPGEFTSKLFPNETFDLVVIKDGLEQSLNPIELLKNIHESLNPDGVIFFFAANAQERFLEADETIQHHLHFFQANHIEHMLKEVGFHVEIGFKFGIKKKKKDVPVVKSNSEEEAKKSILSIHYWRHHPSEVKWNFLYNHGFFSKICSALFDREKEVVRLDTPEGRQFFILAKKV